MYLRLFSILLTTIVITSCSNKEPIYKPKEKVDPYKIYEEAYSAFEKNDFFYANKKFLEAELNFVDIDLAAKSAAMSCFSLYGINFYDEALENIERFLKTYPANEYVIYAEYLKALIYFEQIADEKRYKTTFECKSRN